MGDEFLSSDDEGPNVAMPSESFVSSCDEDDVGDESPVEATNNIDAGVKLLALRLCRKSRYLFFVGHAWLPRARR